MTRWLGLYAVLMWLSSCTDDGVIGERAPAKAGSGGATSHSATAGAGGQSCPFGLCELPPFCTSPERFCVFCDSDADCVRDPAEPFCSPLYGTCVACRSNADCTPDAPYCDGGECGECALDWHCPDDFKCDDARCERD